MMHYYDNTVIPGVGKKIYSLVWDAIIRGRRLFEYIRYLESTSVNYSRLQFSKHSHYFLINYGNCTICATCAISGRNTFQLVEMIEDDLKCTFPEQNSDSKL